MTKFFKRALFILVLVAGIAFAFNLVPQPISDFLSEHASATTLFLSLLAFFGSRQDLEGRDKAGAILGLLIAFAAVISLIAQGYVFKSWPILLTGVVVLMVEIWLLKRWWPTEQHRVSQ